MLAFEDHDVRMSSSIRFGLWAQFVYPEFRREARNNRVRAVLGARYKKDFAGLIA
jgi:hypothetical protein